MTHPCPLCVASVIMSQWPSISHIIIAFFTLIAAFIAGILYGTAAQSRAMPSTDVFITFGTDGRYGLKAGRGGKWDWVLTGGDRFASSREAANFARAHFHNPNFVNYSEDGVITHLDMTHLEEVEEK